MISRFDDDEYMKHLAEKAFIKCDMNDFDIKNTIINNTEIYGVLLDVYVSFNHLLCITPKYLIVMDVFESRTNIFDYKIVDVMIVRSPIKFGVVKLMSIYEASKLIAREFM